ncbi:COG1011 Predicted hydrolase (HAD superfamily) [Burkholderiaceae bacterium]|jgi:2-haloacid dehalogenase
MIRLVVFDAYGTLFDVYSISSLAESLFPGQGQALSVLWRDKQIEYSRLISLSDPMNPMGSRHYQSFWDLTRLGLQYACQRLELELTPAKQKRLMDQYAQLTPFPENLAVLEALQSLQIPAAILSNGSPDMLQAAVSSAGMGHVIDKVLSVDEVRQFKTSPQSYGLVADHYKVDIREVLFVSSNSWDALGATWFGFKSFWVNRQGMPFETLGPRPTYSGRSLRDILTLI